MKYLFSSHINKLLGLLSPCSPSLLPHTQITVPAELSLWRNSDIISYLLVSNQSTFHDHFSSYSAGDSQLKAVTQQPVDINIQKA